jgi:hypothetical protein
VDNNGPELFGRHSCAIHSPRCGGLCGLGNSSEGLKNVAHVAQLRTGFGTIVARKQRSIRHLDFQTPNLLSRGSGVRVPPGAPLPFQWLSRECDPTRPSAFLKDGRGARTNSVSLLLLSFQLLTRAELDCVSAENQVLSYKCSTRTAHQERGCGQLPDCRQTGSWPL